MSEAAYEFAKLHSIKAQKNIYKYYGSGKSQAWIWQKYFNLAQAVRKWVKRGTTIGYVGQTSPMAAIEPCLVECILKSIREFFLLFDSK